MTGEGEGFDVARWRRRVGVALGQEPADLLLAGGTVVNVLSGETYQADVAVVDGVIAGVGDYTSARERLDLAGKWICPSFIDAHVHTESALVWLPEFARAVVPHGTGAVVTDPHEIANIAGLPGLEAMRSATKGLPLGVYFTVPSCVPASAWESPGATIRLATWNGAEYWRLDGWGAVAPGFRANLVVLDDLERVKVSMTIFEGRIVAQNGQLVAGAVGSSSIPELLRDSIHLAPIALDDLRLPQEQAHRAVGVIPGEIATRLVAVEPETRGGLAIASPERDLLKLVCVERHRASGRVGVGYVQGFGLKRGAVASSIAHDAHNIVAVGADDDDLLLAISTVASLGGGLAAVANGQVLAEMALPVAGILSDRPLQDVASSYEKLETAARDLGSALPSPFGLLAFLALSVIPEARVTDHGFVQVG